MDKKPSYIHDFAHCSKNECKLKNLCYRYFLGQEIKDTDWTCASFVMPDKTGNECAYFLNKNNY